MIKKINLTNEIDSFHNNGFTIFDKFLLEENIEILKNRFDDLFDGKFENTIEPDEWNWKKNYKNESIFPSPSAKSYLLKSFFSTQVKSSCSFNFIVPLS